MRTATSKSLYVDGQDDVDVGYPIFKVFDEVQMRLRNCSTLQRYVNDLKLRKFEFQSLLETNFKIGYLSAMDIEKHQGNFMVHGSTVGEVDVMDIDEDEAVRKERSRKSEKRKKGRENGFHKGSVMNCQWFPQSPTLFTSSGKDGTVKLWDAITLKLIENHQFGGETHFHWDEVNNNPLVAVADTTSNVSLIDFRTGSSSQSVRCGVNVSSAIRWLPCVRPVLVSGDDEGTVCIWDVRSARKALVKRRVISHRKPCCSIRFSDDGNFLFLGSVSADGVYSLNPLTLQTRAHFKIETTNSLGKSMVHWRNVDICEEGDGFLICFPSNSSFDTSLYVIAVKRDFSDKTFYVRQLSLHLNPVRCVHFRPKHQQLFSSSKEAVARWASIKDVQVPEFDTERRRPEDHNPGSIVVDVNEDEWSDSE